MHRAIGDTCRPWTDTYTRCRDDALAVAAERIAIDRTNEEPALRDGQCARLDDMRVSCYTLVADSISAVCKKQVDQLYSAVRDNHADADIAAAFDTIVTRCARVPQTRNEVKLPKDWWNLQEEQLAEVIGYRMQPEQQKQNVQ